MKEQKDLPTTVPLLTHILVVDPQVGWCHGDASVPEMFDKLSNWLTEEHLWKYVSIACFSNDEDGPFRELLAWWQGFQGDSDKQILDAYESAPHMFVHNTYGLPESYWQYLVDCGVNALMLSGVETDATISKVAMDAFDRGIRVATVGQHIYYNDY